MYQIQTLNKISPKGLSRLGENYTCADAMEHPEQYPTLVVRVSGFSDYFVRLPRAVQLDILNRTQHE